MIGAVLDASKPFTTHFGAISCLHKLGAHVVNAVLLDNVVAYSAHFQQTVREGSPQVRLDGARVQEALVVCKTWREFSFWRCFLFTLIPSVDDSFWYWVSHRLPL